jgi:FlaA1/EpsC-like NDP-sugar epimerase
MSAKQLEGPTFIIWLVTDMERILVTGATGKVGQTFIGRLLASGD